MNNDKNIARTLLVGVDFTHGDTGVLIVGERLPGSRGTKIINAFQGEEARTLYEKLITKTGEEK
jgi:hypothetical protein